MLKSNEDLFILRAIAIKNLIHMELVASRYYFIQRDNSWYEIQKSVNWILSTELSTIYSYYPKQGYLYGQTTKYNIRYDLELAEDYERTLKKLKRGL